MVGMQDNEEVSNLSLGVDSLEQQFDDEQNKNKIIIKGRRVKRRPKNVYYFEESDSENDLDARISIKLDRSKGESSRYSIKSLPNKLLSTGGKILTHWNENSTRLDLNLVEKTNSIINKITSSASDTIFPTELKTSIKTFDNNWCSDLQGESKENEEKEKADMEMQQEIHVSLHDSLNKDLSENLMEPTEQSNNLKPQNDSLKIDPFEKTQRLLDQRFNESSMVFSNFNSWFSNISSATKIAASTTVTHAVKKFTSNAQNLLHNTGISSQVETVSLPENITEEDTNWNNEWDDEPIQLKKTFEIPLSCDSEINEMKSDSDKLKSEDNQWNDGWDNWSDNDSSLQTDQDCYSGESNTNSKKVNEDTLIVLQSNLFDQEKITRTSYGVNEEAIKLSSVDLFQSKESKQFVPVQNADSVSDKNIDVHDRQNFTELLENVGDPVLNESDKIFLNIESSDSSSICLNYIDFPNKSESNLIEDVEKKIDIDNNMSALDKNENSPEVESCWKTVDSDKIYLEESSQNTELSEGLGILSDDTEESGDIRVDESCELKNHSISLSIGNNDLEFSAEGNTPTGSTSQCEEVSLESSIDDTKDTLFNVESNIDEKLELENDDCSNLNDESPEEFNVESQSPEMSIFALSTDTIISSNSQTTIDDALLPSSLSMFSNDEKELDCTNLRKSTIEFQNPNNPHLIQSKDLVDDGDNIDRVLNENNIPMESNMSNELNDWDEWNGEELTILINDNSRENKKVNQSDFDLPQPQFFNETENETFLSDVVSCQAPSQTLSFLKPSDIDNSQELLKTCQQNPSKVDASTPTVNYDCTLANSDRFSAFDHELNIEKTEMTCDKVNDQYSETESWDDWQCESISVLNSDLCSNNELSVQTNATDEEMKHESTCNANCSHLLSVTIAADMKDSWGNEQVLSQVDCEQTELLASTKSLQPDFLNNSSLSVQNDCQLKFKQDDLNELSQSIKAQDVTLQFDCTKIEPSTSDSVINVVPEMKHESTCNTNASEQSCLKSLITHLEDDWDNVDISTQLECEPKVQSGDSDLSNQSNICELQFEKDDLNKSIKVQDVISDNCSLDVIPQMKLSVSTNNACTESSLQFLNADEDGWDNWDSEEVSSQLESKCSELLTSTTNVQPDFLSKSELFTQNNICERKSEKVDSNESFQSSKSQKVQDVAFTEMKLDESICNANASQECPEDGWDDWDSEEVCSPIELIPTEILASTTNFVSNDNFSINDNDCSQKSDNDANENFQSAKSPDTTLQGVTEMENITDHLVNIPTLQTANDNNVQTNSIIPSEHIISNDEAILPNDEGWDDWPDETNLTLDNIEIEAQGVESKLSCSTSNTIAQEYCDKLNDEVILQTNRSELRSIKCDEIIAKKENFLNQPGELKCEMSVPFKPVQYGTNTGKVKSCQDDWDEWPEETSFITSDNHRANSIKNETNLSDNIFLQKEPKRKTDVDKLVASNKESWDELTTDTLITKNNPTKSEESKVKSLDSFNRLNLSASVKLTKSKTVENKNKFHETKKLLSSTSEPNSSSTHNPMQRNKPNKFKFNVVDSWGTSQTKREETLNEDEWATDWDSEAKSTHIALPETAWSAEWELPVERTADVKPKGRSNASHKPVSQPHLHPSLQAGRVAKGSTASAYHLSQIPPSAQGTYSTQSSGWFDNLKSATKTAAVTTVTHAVKNWSFNPTNLLDSVVDNLSNVVGIPTAEEMASVMKQTQPKK